MITDFQGLTISHEKNLKVAMKQIDATAKKILFVVDDKTRIVGSLSDGDIRRWILSGGSLDAKIRGICFKTPYCVNSGFSLDEVIKEASKRKIEFVPVLNDKRQVIDILTAEKLFESGRPLLKKRKINMPVMIMAGGKGTRLDPFTKILPKPLIPIGEKAVIEIIIDKFLEYGVDLFYISINHKAKIIKSYFEELDPPYKVRFIQEDVPLGTAGALKKLEKTISGSFITTNCDIIIDADYNEIVDHHIREKNDITVVASVKHYNIPYGICKINNRGILKDITEKPEYSFLVNTGMYVVDSKVLKHIPPNEIFHATTLFKKVSDQGGRTGIFPISEKAWADVGEWEQYVKAIERIKPCLETIPY
jgi:dTDP-glucose pyrophosphorylase